ncbi:thioesterase family protein [Streptomyces sp. NPDC048564]|uniref:thioesterase family protein n=1 Tax=Streptomyces sp. NPDC048564 TaxID=3155760 RepID=UPI003448A8BD
MNDPRQTPFTVYRTTVPADWIDYNGHMNDVCYMTACAQASEVFLDTLGLGAAYRERTGSTLYTAAATIRYHKEARLGDQLTAGTVLVRADPKRLLVRNTLWDTAAAELAIAEFLYLHVNQAKGRVEAMPDDRQTLVNQVLYAHGGHDTPRPTSPESGLWPSRSDPSG